MKIPITKEQYIKKIEVNADHVNLDFVDKKKVALLFIGINAPYWPYLKQVIEDCKIHFLPHHHVDYFVWTDIPEKGTEEHKKLLERFPTTQQIQELAEYAKDTDELQLVSRNISQEVIKQTVDFIHNEKSLTIIPTGGIEWPAPTLMRYHLFLNEEEKLKEYDYIFYLDADMRVVQKISDEILGEGLTAAPHPGYYLAGRMIPPYEPNPESSAYIHRLGAVGTDEQGLRRFIPFYAAGGFQGGSAKPFLEAMKWMKENIDKDFNKNYTAIWNDESHWNKYLWDYKGKVTYLDPSYVYPDSLIKEFYEPYIWGRSFEPKIITLTKPASLSRQAGNQLRAQRGVSPLEARLLPNKLICDTCGDILQLPNIHLRKVLQCNGSRNQHQVETVQL